MKYNSAGSRFFCSISLLTCLLLLSFGREMEASTLIVPGYAATNQAYNSAEGIFTSIVREQVVYNASEFPPYPIVITEIRWRPDGISSGPVTTTISNIQVNLSTTTNSADHLSTTYSENTGTNDTVVFSGAMNVTSDFTTLPNGTKAFDIDLPLQTGFLFDPAQGNLLIDIRNFTGCSATLYDNSASSGSDSVSRVFNAGDPNASIASSADTGGGVVEVVYSLPSTPPSIESQPGPTNQTVFAGDTATFTATAVGQPPLYYQWFLNSTNAPVVGATNNVLTLVNIQSDQAGGYFLQVSNDFGTVYSSNASLMVISTPIITSQPTPTNQTLAVGDTARFTATAVGPLPLYYQWFLNSTNAPVVGETNNVLTLVNIQSDQAGDYFLQVSNNFGTVYSSNAGLMVIPTPIITSQPVNQTALPGESATFTVAADSVAPLTYQWFFNATNLVGGATNASVTITNVQLPLVGNYSVQVVNAYGATDSLTAFLSIGVIVPNKATNSQTYNTADGQLKIASREQAVYDASEFPVYPIIIRDIRWRPDGISGGPISTTISNIQVDLSTTTNLATHLSLTFSQNTGTDNITVFSGALNVHSLFTTLPNGTKDFDIDLPLQASFLYDPSKGNLLVGIQNFTGCQASLYDNSLNGSDAESRVVNSVNPNATVASFGDTGAGVVQIGYSPAPLPPTIISQPTNQVVSVGRTTTFSVIAGGPPLSYQWFYNDVSHPIDSATNSSLTLTNVQPGQVGIYFVQVADAYGATASSNVALTVTTDPPSISSQPAGKTILKGTDASFAVSANGSLPMTFQWFFNTNNSIPDATNAMLMLTNVQMSQMGMYSVAVSNAYGFTNSVYTLLTVTNLPAVIQIGTNGITLMGGSPVDIPVSLVANGNENTLEFSVNFSTQMMSYAGITLGSGASDAALLPNTTQATNGRIGVTMQLPSGETFAPGTQEVVRVTLLSAALTGTQSVVIPINFTNTPINKLLFDAQGNRLATNFINGSITITPSSFEGDVTPRPSGDQSLDIFDWSQVGRFVAGIDAITNSSEFQRADCAPKATSGDGQLKVTDWVQAGRYAAAIDSPVDVGGPGAPVAPVIFIGGPRAVTIANSTAVQGLPFTLPITLQSQGDENAVGFSLQFDPTVLKYTGTVKGSAASSATLDVNSNQVASGIVGVALALPAGNNFSSGAQEIAKVNFTTLVSVTNYLVHFVDAPVLRAISDPLANELSANYSNGTLTINPPPLLGINLTDTNALLSWPTWAAGFSLQSEGSPLASGWTNISSTAQTNGNSISVLVPLTDSGAFFRLQHP